MSNTFQSIASGVWNLKIFYQGPLQDQFNEDCKIYKMAEKSKFAWNGLQVNRPLRTRRNQGIGATSDGGPLPSIGKQVGVQAIIPAKFNYLRFGITGPMIKASMSDKGSFVRQSEYELRMGYKDLQSDCNRQNSWNGDGNLAKVNTSAAGSTSISIKGRETGEAALKFLDIGAAVDIVSGSTGLLVASNVTVTGYTVASPLATTATITLSSAVTVTADDYFIRANSQGNEVQGLLTQLDGLTTTVFGIDRSQYISTQGNSSDLGGAQLKLIDIQTAYQTGHLRGGEKYGAIYSDFDSQTYYTKLLQADKRYVNTNKGDAGFGTAQEMTLEYNGTPWMADKDCPKRIFFLAEGMIEKAVLAEMDFADETGSMMIAQTGSDSFEVRVRHFYNLFNSMASSCAVIKNYVSP